MIVQAQKEIEYQEKMLRNLQKWMRNVRIVSSIGVVLAYWLLKVMNGTIYHILGIIDIVFVVVCIVFCAVIGFALKRGRDNVDQIKKVVKKIHN